jgi:hypothetical protein
LAISEKMRIIGMMKSRVRTRVVASAARFGLAMRRCAASCRRLKNTTSTTAQMSAFRKGAKMR